MMARLISNWRAVLRQENSISWNAVTITPSQTLQQTLFIQAPLEIVAKPCIYWVRLEKPLILSIYQAEIGQPETHLLKHPWKEQALLQIVHQHGQRIMAPQAMRTMLTMTPLWAVLKLLILFGQRILQPRPLQPHHQPILLHQPIPAHPQPQ